MLFPLPRNQFFQLIQSHQPGRLGIMAHELQPVMPTAVPGLPLKLTDSDLELCILDFDGFWAHPTCWTVALPLASSCGPGKLWRQVFQTVSERAGRCASREKMDESQGCHQPDEKCAGLRSSAFFCQQKSNKNGPTSGTTSWGHAGSRYTPALCDLGVCAQQHVGVFWNKAPTERLLLVFLVMKQLASVSWFWCDSKTMYILYLNLV